MNIYEQILAGLQTKFTGADTATLQRIASKRSEGVTDEAQVTSIVEGVTLTDVMNNYGDFRANGAQRTAVENYEKKHKLKDGKLIEEPKPQDPPKPTEPSNEVPEWAKSLIEANKELKEQLANFDAKNKAELHAQRVDEVAKSFGIPSFAYKGKTIAEDADLNAYFTDLKQEMVNSGFQFATPPTGGGSDPKDEASALADLINEGTKKIVEQNK